MRSPSIDEELLIEFSFFDFNYLNDTISGQRNSRTRYLSGLILDNSKINLEIICKNLMNISFKKQSYYST